MRSVMLVCLASLTLGACGKRSEEEPKPTSEDDGAEAAKPPSVGPDRVEELRAALLEEVGGAGEPLLYYYPNPVERGVVRPWAATRGGGENGFLELGGPSYVMVADPIGALLTAEPRPRKVGVIEISTGTIRTVSMQFGPIIEHSAGQVVMRDERGSELLAGTPLPRRPLTDESKVLEELGSTDDGGGDEGGEEPEAACPPQAHFIGIDVDGVDLEFIESVEDHELVAKAAGFESTRVLQVGTAREPAIETRMKLFAETKKAIAEVLATGCECPGSLIVVHPNSHGGGGNIYVGRTPEGYTDGSGVIGIDDFVGEVAKAGDFRECTPLVDIAACQSGMYHAEGPPPDPVVVITSTKGEEMCSTGDPWINRDCYYLLRQGAIGIDDYLACVNAGLKKDSVYAHYEEYGQDPPTATMSPAAKPAWTAETPDGCCYRCMCQGRQVLDDGTVRPEVYWLDDEVRTCEPPPFRPQAHCMAKKLCSSWRGKPAPASLGGEGKVWVYSNPTWSGADHAAIFDCPS